MIVQKILLIEYYTNIKKMQLKFLRRPVFCREKARFFGENARFMAKSELYRIAALPFYITPSSARIIIQKMMKTKSKESKCSKTRS